MQYFWEKVYDDDSDFDEYDQFFEYAQNDEIVMTKKQCKKINIKREDFPLILYWEEKSTDIYKKILPAIIDKIKEQTNDILQMYSRYLCSKEECAFISE